ncbi:MAG: DUF1846 domain-containing protein [Bacilli bacterium]
MKTAFDNNKYIKLQSKKIKDRMKLFPDKLYLEFGGKLYDDYHASRVLPGFDANVKVRLLEELKDDCEVVFCINANDIEKNKIRADYGITYDMELLRLIDRLTERGILVSSVVITLYQGQSSASKFQRKLEQKGIKTYIHTPTKGYPTDVDTIVSDEGYGANPYIVTTRKLVIVTAPGAGSGKLATCLSQLYHDYKNLTLSGYAKFETFPVWDLPLKHPINLAYEAATADIYDKNMVDFFHLEKYGVVAINYNRDLETFPILKNVLLKICGKEVYSSPTDMGVNTVSQCITNDELVISASCQEIIRRYYKARCDYRLGIVDDKIPERIKIIMNELNLTSTDRKVVKPALDKLKTSNHQAISLELNPKKIITGRATELLSPASSLILNAIKTLTKIPDEVNLLSPSVLEPIIKLKRQLNEEVTLLSLEEVLIALSICSATNPIVERALDNLKKLNNCEAHATYILEDGDLKALRSLKINFTCEAEYYSDIVLNN